MTFLHRLGHYHRRHQQDLARRYARWDDYLAGKAPLLSGVDGEDADGEKPSIVEFHQIIVGFSLACLVSWAATSIIIRIGEALLSDRFRAFDCYDDFIDTIRLFLWFAIAVTAMLTALTLKIRHDRRRPDGD